MKYFILNGPTAAGKSALLEYTLIENHDFLEPLVSFTTRTARTGERNGKDYYYITGDHYLEFKIKNRIVEQVEYLESLYGITSDELKRVAATRKNGIAIMNLEGIRQLKQNVGYQKVISIFIYRDLSCIFNSIRQSEIEEQEKRKRMELAKQEMRSITSCDHVVYNTASLADASKQLVNIIKKEINSQAIERTIIPGQRYRHCQGETFEIVADLAEHTETCSPLVIYRSISSGKLYARPYELFCDKKQWPPQKGDLVNRFELIEDA